MDWWCPSYFSQMATFNIKSHALSIFRLASSKSPAMEVSWQPPRRRAHPGTGHRHRSAAVRASTSWQATVPTAISAPIATFLMRNLGGGSHDGLGDLDQWWMLVPTSGHSYLVEDIWYVVPLVDIANIPKVFKDSCCLRVHVSISITLSLSLYCTTWNCQAIRWYSPSMFP